MISKTLESKHTSLIQAAKIIELFITAKVFLKINIYFFIILFFKIYFQKDFIRFECINTEHLVSFPKGYIQDFLLNQ